MKELMEQSGKHLLVRVPRELDHHTADKIRRQADYALTRKEIQSLVFDFTETVFCDSSGIGMLVGRYKVIHALGGEMRAVHVNSQVYRILQMSGMPRLFPVCRDESTEQID